jgi:hypothetical protein
MKKLSPWAGFMLAAFAMARTGYAGTLHGTVNNGTTGKPGAGVEVVLIQLQGGMTPVGRTKSDASGQFTLENPGVGGQPMLVRAVYKGVNFHQPLPPGKDSVTVEVFEPTQDSKSISVPSHVVIFQPNGSSLTVGEEYEVKNGATPPQAYYKADGNFEVTLPEKADLKQIAASGPSGMPVVQAPIDKGKNRYAIAFAFRPGESDVRMSYELPYPNNSATVKLPTTFAGRLLVVAPPQVKLSGDGLTMAGQEQGMNIYERAVVEAGTFVSVALSGTAPPPSSVAGADGGGAPGRAENVQGGDAAGAQIQSIPGRLDSLKWPLIAGFCVLFVMAAVLLARKPVALAVPSDAAFAVTEGRREAPAGGAVAKNASSTSNGDSLAALDQSTAVSLDALKDQLFRLELRRQAGTISEEEYARDRAKAEQVLRELVRG